jgi:ATP-dependent DNA helicase RecG
MRVEYNEVRRIKKPLLGFNGLWNIEVKRVISLPKEIQPERIAMNWPEIVERITSGETDTVEFKRGLGDLKPIGRTIAAFANTMGGVLILGVEDNGEIVGIRHAPEATAERLTAFLQTGLNTPVQAKIDRHEDANGWVFWIEVPRQRGFEPLRFEGRVWVRRARASVEPSPSELQDLYNLFGYIVTEERAVEAAGVDSIEIHSFQNYLERLGLDLTTEPRLNLDRDLVNRGVLVEIGGTLRSTLYGLLAFGKNPQLYPQTQSFWIECVSYGGTDRADDVLQTAEGRGRIDEQVERALGWFKGLCRLERYTGLRREDALLLPVKALREVLVNAVVHRDYAITGSKVLLEVFDDRVVVTSPGALPNSMTPESVRAGGHPRSRNEALANYMAAVGMMEQRGRGWPVIRRSMLDHNGTEPDLLEDRNARFVRVTMWIGSNHTESE